MPATPPPTSSCLWDTTAGGERRDPTSDQSGAVGDEAPAESLRKVLPMSTR